MSSFSSQFHVLLPNGDKLYIGDNVRCSYRSKSESAGCWHGKVTQITSRGIYIDVGNKRDKYVCFIDIAELSLTK